MFCVAGRWVATVRVVGVWVAVVETGVLFVLRQTARGGDRLDRLGDIKRRIQIKFLFFSFLDGRGGHLPPRLA